MGKSYSFQEEETANARTGAGERMASCRRQHFGFNSTVYFKLQWLRKVEVLACPAIEMLS